MKKTIRRLGVFDSGVGGLTILKELINLPIPEFIYFADTAHLPYGEKSQETIQRLTLNAINFLRAQNVDAVVIACHTASANAGDYLKKQIPHLTLFDVVTPVINHAIQQSPHHRIGIMGTQATINTHIHAQLIHAQNPQAIVTEQASPLLVPLIEQGLTNLPALTSALKTYLSPFVTNNCDALILGCTHYELLKEHITPFFKKDNHEIQLISAAETTPNYLRPFTEPAITSSPRITYFVSGETKLFEEKTKKLLGWTIHAESLNEPSFIRFNASSRTPLTNL